MADNEKDRLGDKLRDAERAREDQYFAERDRKLVDQMRQHKGQGEEPAQRDATRMRCPKCGEPLVRQAMHGVRVEECPGCRGVWLAKGELEAIARGEEEGWITRWLRREFTKPD